MIYIVEDDENIREMESYALKNSGFEVIGFGEGKSFLLPLKKEFRFLLCLTLCCPVMTDWRYLKK